MSEMFCFQCEQTAGCKGCTGRAGVCGKPADVANLQDRLTGALIGLAVDAGGKCPSRQADERLPMRGNVIPFSIRVYPRPAARDAGACQRPHRSFSSPVIAATRRAWRPPSNGAASHRSAILIASAGPVRFAARASTFASLCRLLDSAISSSRHNAARTPGILLPTIDIPIPLLQTRIPRAQSPDATARAARAPYSG